MYVCICRGITDTQITEAVAGGATNLGKVRKALGVAGQCGKCSSLAQEIIDETLQMHSATNNSLFYAVA